MNKIMVIIVLSFFQLSSAHALSVISDLDDTLKITNVQDWSEAVKNALFSKKAFGDMPLVVNEMNHSVNGLYILTASPKILNSRVKKFIKHHNLDVKQLFMRSLIDNKEAYKLSIIRSLIKDNPGETFILIGDDSHSDHTVYAQILKESPDAVAAIYVHRVINRALPTGVTGYFTAYDLAVHEYQAGRMSLEQASILGEKFLKHAKLNSYFPSFAYCPKQTSDFSHIEGNDLAEMTKKIQVKILRYCK